MKNPYKIIHKFKNNNGRIQYMIYIFIGPLINEEIVKVFKNISNKDFYTTITTLSKSNFKLLEDTYGEKWYKLLFTLEHIGYSIKKVNLNSNMKKQ